MDVEQRFAMIDKEIKSIQNELHKLVIEQNTNISDLSKKISIMDERMESIRYSIRMFEEKLDKKDERREQSMHKYIPLIITLTVSLLGTLCVLAYELGKMIPQ